MTAALSSTQFSSHSARPSLSTCLAFVGFPCGLIQLFARTKEWKLWKHSSFPARNDFCDSHNLHHHILTTKYSPVWHNAEFTWSISVKYLTCAPLPLLLLLMFIIFQCVCCYTSAAGCSSEKLSCIVSYCREKEDGTCKHIACLTEQHMHM